MKITSSAIFFRRGMSLVEVLTCVTIVGLLAAIAVPRYAGYFSGSRDGVARDRVELLNNAVHRFNEGNYELIVTAVPADVTDEMAVVRTLQYRNPLYPKPGSPYLKPNWNPVSSSSTTDYRIQWTGTLFTLLSPGTAGTGLKIDFNGSDNSSSYSFPANFTMAGS